ncbi:MAG: 6-phospho-3-hexuloisomerase [Lachnospiraceae bacterium]|nr:6-phospho-3-hexuloisomerase [Lachnospiraceae bacterium]
MEIKNVAAAAAREIAETLQKIDENQVDLLVGEILKAKKVYVSGAGRSLLMMRGIAMRLMHLGFESYVVGDTTTPAFEKGDLLIVGSGSGETSGLINVVNKAKKLGGNIAVFTIKKESSLGKMADVLVEIPAFTPKVHYENMKRTILPSGSLFEQCLLVLGDTIVIPLAEKRNIVLEGEFSRHANLE